MSKELTLTVDPRLTDPTKLRAILRINPQPHTNYKRHSKSLSKVAWASYGLRSIDSPTSSQLLLDRFTYNHYID